MEHISDQLRETSVADRLSAAFSSRFGTSPRIFRAPGRVNLIGEHTDYNEGFVLPAAIDLYTWAAIAPRSDHKLSIFSENLREASEIDLGVLNAKPRDHWTDYIQGIVLALRKVGVSVGGADILIYSEVPLGSGLSSSAALEVSVASALLARSADSLQLTELAKVCQSAENEFVGARVGIMDQFASCFGDLNKAILLDCRSLEYKLLPLPPAISMVICNTMVKHDHASGEYNDRRAQCEQGVHILQRYFSPMKSLRDVTLPQIESRRESLPDIIYRRCHHVISENERVLTVVRALQGGDLPTVGACMSASHLSLKNDYQVSCRELDIMVDLAASCTGVIGSRMTGGGFGGCTINLVRSESVAAFKKQIAAAYHKTTAIQPEIYILTAGVGVTEVTANV
jgi:galactokinase